MAEARAGWHAGLAGVGPERLILLDGTGTGTRTTRARGRAARGERAHGEAPRVRRER